MRAEIVAGQHFNVIVRNPQSRSKCFPGDFCGEEPTV